MEDAPEIFEGVDTNVLRGLSGRGDIGGSEIWKIYK